MGGAYGREAVVRAGIVGELVAISRKTLLDEVTYAAVRPSIDGKDPLKGDTIPEKDVDFVTSAVLHRVRKIIRASGKKR